MKDFLKIAAVAGGTWLIVCVYVDVFMRGFEIKNCNGTLAADPHCIQEDQTDLFGNALKQDYTYYLIDAGQSRPQPKKIQGIAPGLHKGDRVKVSTPFLAGPFRPNFSKIEKIK